ncbi:hypothetical protein [Terrisporobacter glycolicus]|uniref:hypothetical protein n=1 Tax=Terrisporobacter glycolicus TaxID=36841 RepID=UPI003463C7E6
MFELFKNLFSNKMGQEDSSLETKEVNELEVDEGTKVPKYILKEDAKIMSIPCDYQNVLPQSLLKIDKTLITNPDNVAVYINLGHLDSVDTIEEGVIDYPEVQNPCGEGTITGQAYLEKVILVGGVNYSVLLFDTVTKTKIYAGDIQYKTAYSLLTVLPLGVEPKIDTSLVKPVFFTKLTRLQDLEGVDYYLYTVDGTVELDYEGVITP